MNAPQRLHAWLQATKTTQAALARAAGVTPSAVCDWLRGHRSPGRDRSVMVEQITGGAVRCCDWSSPPTAPPVESP